MCNSCVPREPIKSKVVDSNPDIPAGRILDYKIRISNEVLELPLDEYMGYISRTLDRQWSALYDAAKEEHIKHNNGVDDPIEFTRP